MAAIASVSMLAAASSAGAVTIASLDVGPLAQGGTLTNQRDVAITGLILDLGVDSGNSAAPTPVWGDADTGTPLSPVPAFSNPVPGVAGGFFTVTYAGISVGNGSKFIYDGLDIDGFPEGNDVVFDGSEFAQIIYADGATVKTFFNAQSILVGDFPDLVFDDSDLTLVPAPAPLALLIAALMGLAALGRGGRLTPAGHLSRA